MIQEKPRKLLNQVSIHYLFPQQRFNAVNKFITAPVAVHYSATPRTKTRAPRPPGGTSFLLRMRN